MGDLKGKYAVITGGAKGLGKAAAERFIADGVEGLAILGRNEDLLRQTAAGLGGGVYPVRCDVADPQSVAAAFEAIYGKLGRVDILVNNAGIARDAMLAKMTTEQWKQVIDIDLNGTFYCIQQVASRMKEQKYGKIVNLSSYAALGNVGQANYSAAKAGVIGLTKTAAKELARHNITVNAICPSLIGTDIIKTIPDNVMKGLLADIPMGRIGEPREVASVISFLSSDDSSYVTGQAILISGGM
ncbi:MAG: SDR family oxidoreductase [Clostridiales Family XIII bacterium]|jgi:3-oxoacyl-[acyl-carrier protein] reductase|nr:SDR family oxidoreductase [Clostridiales Family XIII bacterium]